jgi:hypothetical protein
MEGDDPKGLSAEEFSRVVSDVYDHISTAVEALERDVGDKVSAALRDYGAKNKTVVAIPSGVKEAIRELELIRDGLIEIRSAGIPPGNYCVICDARARKKELEP